MVMVGVVILAMSPVLLAVFGRGWWDKMCGLIFNILVHPQGPVVVFPAGWRRTVVRMVRPPHKDMPVVEKDVS